MMSLALTQSGRDPLQVYAEHLRTGKMVRVARHGQGHVQPAGANAQHGNTGSSRGVAVGAQDGLAGDAKALHMDLVRHAVAGVAVVNAVSSAGRLQKLVIIGVLVVGLEEVMIDILHSQFYLDPIQPEGFKFQHGHGAGGILEQRVVDADSHF